jgi:pimeloyl-ACP methyl ester carboxylesterase
MMLAITSALKPLPRPDWLPIDVWPFETAALEVDRSTVAVSEAGRGPSLLFYTGIGSFIWRDVMLLLSAEFRCITLDPPGIGLSAPVPRTEATLQRSARAVAAAIEAFDLRDVTLVAHDSGGPPAFAAAARLPDRIRGLVGVNTFGWRPASAAFRGMLAVMGSGLTRQLSVTTGALARLTATSFGVGRQLDDASRHAYRAGLQKGMSAFHDYLNDARDSDLYDEVTRGLTGPLADLPLLTIFGERNDPLKFQPRWKALFPAARQLVIPKGNHFPMCDDPNVVAGEIHRWHREFVHAAEERRS